MSARNALARLCAELDVPVAAIAHPLALLEMEGVASEQQLRAADPELLRNAGLPEPLVRALEQAAAGGGGGGGGEPADASAGVEEAKAAASPAVPFEVEPDEAGGPGAHLIRLRVPAGAAAAMAAHPIFARGSSFALETTADPTELVCRIVSPAPEATAAVIADRVGRRLDDPNPPGMESCVVA